MWTQIRQTRSVSVARLHSVCCIQSAVASCRHWYAQHRNPWSDAAVSSNCPLAPTLFYCLLNAGLAYDPIGWGVPYGSSWVSDFDEPLADMSLQVLAALLDYAPFVNRRAAGLSPTGAVPFAFAPLCSSPFLDCVTHCVVSATSADEADDEAENARSDGETSQGVCVCVSGLLHVWAIICHVCDRSTADAVQHLSLHAPLVVGQARPGVRCGRHRPPVVQRAREPKHVPPRLDEANLVLSRDPGVVVETVGRESRFPQRAAKPREAVAFDRVSVVHDVVGTAGSRPCGFGPHLHLHSAVVIRESLVLRRFECAVQHEAPR